VFPKIVYDVQQSARVRDWERTRNWGASAICQPFVFFILILQLWKGSVNNKTEMSSYILWCLEALTTLLLNVNICYKRSFPFQKRSST